MSNEKPRKFPKKKEKPCLGCGKKFNAISKFNRFCTKCTEDIELENLRAGKIQGSEPWVRRPKRDEY